VCFQKKSARNPDIRPQKKSTLSYISMRLEAQEKNNPGQSGIIFPKPAGGVIRRRYPDHEPPLEYFFRMSEALVPPKPNELVMAVFTSISRALCGV
jgi:hypothetical protein